MKLFFIGLFLLAIVSFAYAGVEQKLEGKCSGQLENGSQVGFSYFSDYEGCQGNISGVLDYSGLKGNRHSITVQCVIRDYEYEECPE